MGQYFRPVNIDKGEYLNPIRFGDGQKLLEFGASMDGTMTGLSILLRKSSEGGGGDIKPETRDKFSDIVGSWAGDRIAIVGDYDDSEISDRVWSDKLKDISDKIVEVMEAENFDMSDANEFWSKLNREKKKLKKEIV